MDPTIYNAIVSAFLPYIPTLVGAVVAVVLAWLGWLGKQAVLRKAAVKAAEDAEAAELADNAAKKRHAMGRMNRTLAGKFSTMTNMQAVLEQHAVPEMKRRASMVPKPNPETDDTK